MQKKILFALALTLILCYTDSSPVNLGSLEFDNLDTDLSDLTYEVNEGDLNDFFTQSEKKNKNGQKSKSKTKVSASGFEKKNSIDNGLEAKFNINDLKKILKEAGIRDSGSYDDGGIYALAKGKIASGVGITGNEERKYRKGTKSKGFHRVSHKDEYKKDKEFYEDDETSGVIKKVGAKGLGFEIGAGAGLKKGYFNHNRNKGIYGKDGFSDEGNVNKQYKSYSDSEGFDAYFNSEK